MRNEGWIKLWRKALDSDVFADAELWRLFCWCLLSANHTIRHVSVATGRGQTVVTLAPGQFLTGRKVAAEELKMPETTFRRRIERLESMGVILRKPATHFSVISIVNWGFYQSLECTCEPTNGHPTNQPTATDKNDKNGKNGKNDKNDKKNSAPVKRFCKPTVGEVTAYCRERKNAVDPQRFFDFYESNGWRVGRNPMRDWKAAVRSWESNHFPSGKKAEAPEAPYEKLYSFGKKKSEAAEPT